MRVCFRRLRVFWVCGEEGRGVKFVQILIYLIVFMFISFPQRKETNQRNAA
jgi:hypothetical protein